MKIWILDCDVDNYENLTWKKELDIDYIQSFDGAEKIKDWNPMQVKRMYDRVFSNTPGLSPHIPVFDDKAICVLRNLLIGNAEILPLDCEDGSFYAINVINVIDCIDYEKSTYKTFRDGKRIMRFTKYVFKHEKIKGVNLFKIKDEPLKRPFVSDEFKQTVEKNNLLGFKFKLAWDSEQE
ncbi:MAG: hypothetical protein E7284_08630 [Lachnospiraceae bacterium]|nr:hypothetical protein [Lachnospiraceae bacterium]